MCCLAHKPGASVVPPAMNSYVPVLQALGWSGVRSTRWAVCPHPVTKTK
jgi:hypothetical protein